MTEINAIGLRVESPAVLINEAINKGASLDQLKQLLEIKERYEANEAKKAFVKAMTEFKAEAPKVIKDKINKQYNSKYTSLSNLVNTVNPVLSKYGLSASWDIKQNGTIEVICKITHAWGHSEIASASAPADESGSKNKVQQIKSTITYLKAVTFESICGLASSETSLDDDGNNYGETINDTQQGQIADFMVDYTTAKQKSFLDYMGVEKVADIKKSDYQKAIKALESANKKKQ